LTGNKSKRSPGRTKETEQVLGGGDPLDKWRRCRSRIDEPKKSSPAGFPDFGGDVEGSIKERLKDEAEEVEKRFEESRRWWW
jgi:hypothetical protein